MSFPTGWAWKGRITIDHTKVTGTPTGFILLVTAAMMPVSMIDAGSHSAQTGGGDIRFTTDSAGTTRLPCEVVDFLPHATAGSRRCEIYVDMSGHEPSSSVDTVIYVWCRAATTMQQPAPSQPFGAEQVWSGLDYRAVHHMDNRHQQEATGLWLIRPRAVEYSGATYVTWLDYLSASPGNIRVAKYTHSTGLWTAAVTIAASEAYDAHGAPSLCVDNSGYLHVTWGGFSTTGNLKTVKSTNPGDISAWGSVVTVASGLTEPTYPCMLCLSGGNLVLFSREADVWHRRVSTDSGATWGNDQAILGTGNRTYTEWVLGASDRVHLAWHTTASSGATNGLNLYYAYSDNANASTSTWKAADATTLTLPANDTPTTVSTGRVYNSVGGGFDTSYLMGLAVNGSNAPMLAAGLFVAATPSSNRASSFTYSAGTWTKVDITTGSTVGLVASPNTRMDGGVRYLSGTTWRALVSVTVSGKAEVQEWETTDGGGTWAKAADVTTASSLGNDQAQYVRGSTGPLVATHFSTTEANLTGSAFNATHDIWLYGSHTDYVGSWARDIITATSYLRDSTKYHNDAVRIGSPTMASSSMPFGGNAYAFNGSQQLSIANDASISTDLGATFHQEFWAKHTGSGSAEKVACKNPSAGGGTPWLVYRNGSNDIVTYFGSASTFVAPSSSGGAVTTSAYRYASQFFSNSGSARLNKTAIAGVSLTGPLATVTDAVHIGETHAGQIDEFRMCVTQVAAATLDTQYDNAANSSTFAAGVDDAISAGASIALGACATSSTATLAINAASAVTLGACAASAAGTLPIAAAASISLAACATSAAGAVAIQATASVTLGNASTTAAGALAITGAAAVSLAACTLQSDASVHDNSGVAAITLAAVTASAAGRVDIAAALGITLGDCLVSAVIAGSRIGAADISLSGCTLAAAGEDPDATPPVRAAISAYRRSRQATDAGRPRQ